MKILRKVCPHCGAVHIFSVAVLCRPGTADEFGSECPYCRSTLGVHAVATELDIEEIGPEPDPVVMLETIQRFT